MLKQKNKVKIVIIGAGPSGLFASYLLLKKGYKVHLYDHSSGPGKKFLVAGNGGLNLTHSEPLDTFQSKYAENEERFSHLLRSFSPSDLIKFCDEIGIETFSGSSGRVFPKEMNAANMIRNWIEKLKEHDDFKLHLNHHLNEIKTEGSEFVISIINKKKSRHITINSDYLLLGLGGGSWKRTGSDGVWVSLIRSLDILVHDFFSYNCGYEVSWSNVFKNKVDHSFLKNIAINGKVGEVMLTPYGIEGSLIYANSKNVQNQLKNLGEAKLNLDLRPQNTVDELITKLKKKRSKDSKKNQLRKCLKLGHVEYQLVTEILGTVSELSDRQLAEGIKNLEINLLRARPLDEAISTGGGVDLLEVDEHFESFKHRGLFFLGEMLNWDAPTGGYLLQGCFSIAHRVVQRF